MGKHADRMRRQKESRSKTAEIYETLQVDESLVVNVAEQEGGSSVYNAIKSSIDSQYGLDFSSDSHASRIKIDNLLDDIRAGYEQDKINNMFLDCQNTVLENIIRPFGLGRILFENKDGGNVDTIHNARSGVYATDKEKSAYDNREAYDSHHYHSHDDYIAKNRKDSKAFKEGNLQDSYTKGKIRVSSKKNLDHTVSASEIHHDPGRILADVDGADLANVNSNLNSTSETINKTKQHKTVAEYQAYIENTKRPNLENKISNLSNKSNLTDKEKKQLAHAQNQLKELDKIDFDKMHEHDKQARKEIDAKINSEYYGSKKFATAVAKTSAVEAGKMGLQQAIGIMLEEFVRSCFDEIKDIWNNGFKGGNLNDSFFSVMKERLKRIATRVASKWKDAVTAFKDGAIAGFFSNIITVIINIFKTTSGRIVRMIREGFMSFLRAVKMLLFPPEDMTWREAAHAATKILAGGAILAGGIMLEEVIEKAILTSLPVLAPYTTIISSVLLGLATGITTVFATWILDKADLFGVEKEARHKAVINKLQSITEEYYDKAMEDSKIFDSPELLHLT